VQKHQIVRPFTYCDCLSLVAVGSNQATASNDDEGAASLLTYARVCPEGLVDCSSRLLQSFNAASALIWTITALISLPPPPVSTRKVIRDGPAQ
jgi:hypothetical protein